MLTPPCEAHAKWRLALQLATWYLRVPRAASSRNSQRCGSRLVLCAICNASAHQMKNMTLFFVGSSVPSRKHKRVPSMSTEIQSSGDAVIAKKLKVFFLRCVEGWRGWSGRKTRLEISLGTTGSGIRDGDKSCCSHRRYQVEVVDGRVVHKKNKTK